jgi:cytochrome c-type biogenesis protein CcmH/NrfF
MGKKRREKRVPVQSRQKSIGWQPSYWMIVAGILFFFSAGLVAKMVFSPVSGFNSGSTIVQSATINNPNLEGQVKLVAANFRCACGQCGELFLIDCTCDMPKGAVEEKNFIRNQLQQGMTVDQVIDVMDKKYGHRII